MKKNLKPEPGTYIIVLKVKSPGEIEIGKIGKSALEKGYYLYIGSARGPGGIKSRVVRHLKKKKSKRWHIDYLREAGSISAVCVLYSKMKKECEWASKLSDFKWLSKPINGFGSSDCSCASHLFFCKGVFNFSLLKDIDTDPIELLKFP